jgi:hypothetical protein
MVDWIGPPPRVEAAAEAASPMAGGGVPAPTSAIYMAPEATPEPEVAVELLEAQIEAARPEHEPSGPAEPLERVPSLGEAPLPEEPEAVLPAVLPEPAAEPVAPARPRAAAPATMAGRAFNPEVVPADE